MEHAQAELREDFPVESQGAVIKTIQTRFGEVEYQPENILFFPTGLIGFEALHDFIVMPNQTQGPLFWIQSVDDSEVAFVLTDPTNFFPEYQVAPDSEERKKLGMRKEDEVHVLSVVTVSPELNITLNLQAPVLFATHCNRAMQVILDKTTYTTCEPLPQVEKKSE